MNLTRPTSLDAEIAIEGSGWLWSYMRGPAYLRRERAAVAEYERQRRGWLEALTRALVSNPPQDGDLVLNGDVTWSDGDVPPCVWNVGAARRVTRDP